MALFRNFHERHLSITGYVLFATIEIEKKMDQFLSVYFSNENDKQKDFIELILFNERISFDFKKELLSILIKKNYQDFLKSNSKFLSLLEKITPHRNRFAHLDIIEFSELLLGDKILQPDLEKELKNADVNTIIFKRYKGGKVQYIGYNTKEISKLEIMMNNVSDMLSDLISNPPTVNTSAPC